MQVTQGASLLGSFSAPQGDETHPKGHQESPAGLAG